MNISSQNLENSLINVDGYVHPRFKEVLEVFVDNFEHQELGAAVAVYHRGELVVDIAAGLRDRASKAPYSRGTLQPIFSVTKGIIALAANMLADRRHLDLDAPVASYWPEFAQADKSGIPVRWLLTHQSCVLGLDRTISLAQPLDWNLVVDSLAAQAPDWKPDSDHGNQSIIFGFLVGEVIRRVTGQTVGQYVSREIVGPLHADLFIGLPKGEVHRVAPVLLPEPGPGPYAARVLSWIPPELNPRDIKRPEVREAQIPAANGIANARSLARIFAASIGRVDGVRCLRRQAMYRARFEQWRGLDAVMGVQNAMGLGFLLPTEWCPLGGPGSFGAAGYGGSRAWANPELELAFAYTPNLCSVGHFDPREAALSRTAVICAKHLCQEIQRNRRSRS